MSSSKYGTWEDLFFSLSEDLPEAVITPERRAEFYEAIKTWLSAIDDKQLRKIYSEMMREAVQHALLPEKLGAALRHPTQDELNWLLHFRPLSLSPEDYAVWDFKSRRFLVVPFDE